MIELDLRTPAKNTTYLELRRVEASEAANQEELERSATHQNGRAEQQVVESCIGQWL